jgi:hypothetical protein
MQDQPNAQPAPPPSGPLWRKLGDVARELGLHPELLLSAAQSGDLPIRVQKIGAKLWHVNATDVRVYRAWLDAGGSAR